MRETSEKKQALTAQDCASSMLPINDALTLLSGKWKIPIITCLAFGYKRFKEISNELEGISDKVLSKELKDLEENYIITRSVEESFPPKVTYEITEHGRSLEKLILELKNWGLAHRRKIITKHQEG